MIYSLLTAVASAIDILLAGKTYKRRGVTAEIVMPTHVGSLPVRTDPNTEEAPFIVIKATSFDFGRPQSGCVVTVLGVLYTSGTIDAGLIAQDALLQDLAKLKDSKFTDYKLILPIVGTIGDKETGINPHPYYTFSLDLTFRRKII